MISTSSTTECHQILERFATRSINIWISRPIGRASESLRQSSKTILIMTAANAMRSRSKFFITERLVLLPKQGVHRRRKRIRNITIREQVAIYLYAVIPDLPMKKLAERFQRSTNTIHRAYHKVTRCLLENEIYSAAVIKSPTFPIKTHPSIADSSGFFKDCMSAVDGTLIPISSPAEEATAKFRDRKKGVTQNVLAVCNFDMRFTKVLCGWQGGVSDSGPWVKALRCGAIQVPEGKFLLGDAGFANRKTMKNYKIT